MTEIVFVFLIFSQLFRIFSRRNRAGYAMRFTFKALGKTKERAKKLPDQSFSLTGSQKSPIRRRMVKVSCAYEAFAMLLFSVGRSFHHLMRSRPSFQT
mgnify:CR=1 FL=1